jgi:hypothetical protein
VGERVLLLLRRRGALAQGGLRSTFQHQRTHALRRDP